MIISNDDSHQNFFAYPAGRPMTDDRSGLNASVYPILQAY